MSNDQYLSPFFLELLKLRGNVDQYEVFYRGSGPHQGHQPSWIYLSYGGQSIATVWFEDPGPPWNPDRYNEMHLPSAMFENVIDILRSERPITFLFKDSHTFLYTKAEPVGEAE